MDDESEIPTVPLTLKQLEEQAAATRRYSEIMPAIVDSLVSSHELRPDVADALRASCKADYDRAYNRTTEGEEVRDGLLSRLETVMDVLDSPGGDLLYELVQQERQARGRINRGESDQAAELRLSGFNRLLTYFRENAVETRPVSVESMTLPDGRVNQSSIRPNAQGVWEYKYVRKLEEQPSRDTLGEALHELSAYELRKRGVDLVNEPGAGSSSLTMLERCTNHLLTSQTE